ncbi:hypothetical protein LJC04_05060 [Ruminococcaceae bacterium OttesenSCG-928-O06]|nr:hypothetical protein [Ruminococcaceae bacterium OttesenSCG-928-O06]
MRELTFNGFLKSYLQRLSGTETESVNKLLEMARENPRLEAPLVLYAKAALPDPRAARLWQKAPKLGEEAERYFSAANTERELLDLLAAGKAPSQYEKVYRSYVARKNRIKTEQELKELIRAKILRESVTKSVSDYRIYQSLNLNPGNYHAFVRHGDMTKLSLENAKRILAYLENLSTNRIKSGLPSI